MISFYQLFFYLQHKTEIVEAINLLSHRCHAQVAERWYWQSLRLVSIPENQIRRDFSPLGAQFAYPQIFSPLQLSIGNKSLILNKKKFKALFNTSGGLCFRNLKCTSLEIFAKRNKSRPLDNETTFPLAETIQHRNTMTSCCVA